MGDRITAIYTRLSRDLAGKGISVAEQEDRSRAFIVEKLPDVAPGQVKVFTDNDISAASPDEYERGDFNELVRLMKAGKVENVVARDPARLFRNPVDWWNFRQAALKNKVTAYTYRTGEKVELRNVMLSGIGMLADTDYVAKIQENALDTAARRARDGLPGGGRVFGYKNVCDAHGLEVCEIRPGVRCSPRTLRPNPDEAGWVKWGAEKVLAGWSLSSIGQHFDKMGVKTPRGGKWRPTSVKQVLTSHTITGLRTHNGEIHEGRWEPILDRATWAKVRAKLFDPGRASVASDGTPTRSRPGARRYLLVGLVVCGKCGTPMRTGSHISKATQAKIGRYFCPPKSYGGCNGVSMNAETLERLVEMKLMLRRENDEEATALADREDTSRRDEILRLLEALRIERKDWGRRRALGDLDDDTWEGLLAGSQQRERLLNAELADLPSPMDVDPVAVTERWFDATDEEKREILRRWIKRVVVQPGIKGGQPELDVHSPYWQQRVEVYGRTGVLWQEKAHENGEATPFLTHESRRGDVVKLHGDGLSNRVIAERLSVDESTVRSDLRRLGLKANANVKGKDGKTYSVAS